MPRISTISNWPLAVLISATAAVCLSAPGCNTERVSAKSEKKQGSSDSTQGKDSVKGGGQRDPAALALVEHMIEAYATAKSYTDNATVRLMVKHPDGDQDDRFDANVTFERPNLLRMVRDDTILVSDGEKLFGKPQDWDGQIVVVPAPDKIIVPAFYNIDALAPAMAPTIEGHSVQLDLLASGQPQLGGLAKDSESVHFGKPQVVHERPCARVEFDTEAGKLALLIDQETHVLRRVEFPTDELLKSLTSRGVQAVTLVADYNDAQLDPKLPEGTFQWQDSKDETQVGVLVAPPDPRYEPHPMLGQPAAEFAILKSDSTKVKSSDLNDKITVIDFWATWCPYCLQGMPKFDQARERYKENKKVRFVALSLDDPNVSDQQIAAALYETGAKVDWARGTSADPFNEMREAFDMPGIPAYVILDQKGRVQFHHVGADLDPVQDLGRVIDQLLAGKDPAVEAAKLWEGIQQEYRQQIEVTRLEDGSQVFEIPRAEVAEASAPELFDISKRWNSTELKTPGNMLVTRLGDTPQILVIDQFRDVVQLDAEGQVVKRHKDLLPDKAVVTVMREAKTKDGDPAYVLAGLGQTRLHIFDKDWIRTLSYPEAETAQIYDCVASDLDGDGEAELCIGYFGDAGVHGVTLDGRRLWRNRSMSAVTDVAAGSADEDGKRRIYCTHSGGNVMPLKYDGGEGIPFEVPNRAVTYIDAEDLDGDGQDELCGIAVDISGSRMAIGFSPTGTVLWKRELPRGEHEELIEQLGTIRLAPNEPAYWMIATADGTVHLISHDGKTHDRFGTGQKLTGLVAANIDDQTLLLTTSQEGVTAWEISKKAQ